MIVSRVTDREEGGQAEYSVGLYSSLSFPLNLWIPLQPGHVIRHVQEVEECDESAQDSPRDGSRRRWRRCESVLFLVSPPSQG